MAKISVLDKNVAELIAAGEVVERPSSVIKELVENAVDAKASAVTVEIRGGGIKYMRVTDNGVGIEREDVPTAFLRHATSKVKVANDLDSIFTLGFRGEALASISAVSHVELITKTEAEQVGTRYFMDNSDNFVLEDAGCPNGTTIIIRDLFYNTPARMKFLKRDVTEANAISSIIDKLALSHPEVSFRLIRDGKETFHSSGDSKLSSAIYAVYGKDFTDTMIRVDYEYNHVKVSGYVSSPTASRPNRSMQNFFINGRFIKSRTAGAALDEAFKGSLMVGKFAACVLHIELSFEAVDVNVHPAKLEVRFVNERPIFDAVYHGVKTALSRDDITKTMEFKKPQTYAYAPVERAEQMPLSTSSNEQPMPKESQTLPFSNGNFADVEVAREIYKPSFAEIHSSINEVIEEVPRPENRTPQAEPTPTVESDKKVISLEKHTQLIGEAFDTYIIIEYGADMLMLIDKHAAHERIIYERLKRTETGTEAQTLLSPVTVQLEKDEYSAALANSEQLLEAGFEIEDFGTGVILVRTAPIILDGSDVALSIMEIAGYLSKNKKTLTTEHLDWVYHNVACRAAIKGGNKSSDAELIALAKELEENPEIRYCPHGRPISMIIKRSDIERQFGRA